MATNGRGVRTKAITNSTTALYSRDVDGDDKIILGTSGELPEFICDNAAPEINLHTVSNFFLTFFLSPFLFWLINGGYRCSKSDSFLNQFIQTFLVKFYNVSLFIRFFCE